MTFRTEYPAAALLLTLAACTGQAPDPEGWEGPRGSGAAARDVIGATGGTVELNGASLVVPPGALAEETLVTLIETRRRAPGGHRNYSAVYAIEPEGLRLDAPATLSLPMPRYGPYASMFAADSTAGEFAQLDGVRSGARVSAAIERLSQAFVGDGRVGCGDEPCASKSVERVDKVDLLFAVDNSGSMREEQAALRREFPRLIRILTSGDRDEDGMPDFQPAPDLHLGVVSSDMGLVGVQGIDLCEGLGDDGILRHQPADPSVVTGCDDSYPPFLTFIAAEDDPDAAARDFACIATLGTEGCGYEQQLESVLKAVWPSREFDALTHEPLDEPRVRFLGDSSGFGTLGHGDADNAGFLRNDPVQGRSLVAVIVVTDEEDCSSRDTRHFTPADRLLPDDPLQEQGLNMRCVLNPQNLYPIARYVDGLKALREDADHLVVFAAIAGVPPDLVEGHERDGLSLDGTEREAYYQRILDDPRMQVVLDPGESPEPQDDNPAPACETGNGRAFPARRLVEVARGFGTTGVIQSICQDDFGPAIDTLIECIALQLER